MAVGKRWHQLRLKKNLKRTLEAGSDQLNQGFPTWGTCTAGGTFA